MTRYLQSGDVATRSKPRPASTYRAARRNAVRARRKAELIARRKAEGRT